MSSTNPVFLPVCKLFISLCCLIDLDNISSSMLRSGKSGHPCHIPHLKEELSVVHHLSMMLAVAFSYIN
jgi:hypothetical protein